MFAVEIDFRDGISPPETILLRRSSAILGGSERSHLIIEGAGSSVPEVQLLRGLGRSFLTLPLSASSTSAKQLHQGDANLVFGNYKLHITSLDFDLCLRKDELPDLSAVRVLRQALTYEVEDFPCLALLGENPILVSFHGKSDIVVGRSSFCPLRVDVPDISSEHSRFGFEEGRFWVEDLGSTNGTIVNEKKISGRLYLEAGERVHLGSSAIIVPILNAQGLSKLQSYRAEVNEPEIQYPALCSDSNLVKPKRLALSLGSTISIGRDPTCDIWVNAPHISREHVQLTLEDEQTVKIVDTSSNGTLIAGKRLKLGCENKFSAPNLVELDLCSGVILKVLFRQESKEVGNRKNIKNKLNEENYNSPPASDLLGAEVEDYSAEVSKKVRLSDFEKYQLELSSKLNLKEIFEDEEEFNLLAAKLEQERILGAKAGEYWVVFFIFILVLLIASVCVLIFTSDYYF